MGKSNINIYILKHPSTGDIKYVGQSINIKKRLNCHKCLKETATKGRRLKEWVINLANDGLMPVLEVIECVSFGEGDECEKKHIQLFRNQGCNLLNETIGGKGSNGYKHSNKTRKKMSDIKKGIMPKFIPTMFGKKHSEKVRKFISDRNSGEKNHNYGKETPVEVRQKISEALGRKVTINNVIYPSMRAAAKSLNMRWSTFKYRHDVGNLSNLI